MASSPTNCKAMGCFNILFAGSVAPTVASILFTGSVAPIDAAPAAIALAEGFLMRRSMSTSSSKVASMLFVPTVLGVGTPLGE
jgi:hypothetical protein